METLASVLAALLCFGIYALVLGAPLSVLFVLRQRRLGGPPWRRALLCAVGNGGLSGGSLALLGFTFGASIADELAGEIAVGLAIGGLVAGGLAGAIVGFFLVLLLGSVPKRAGRVDVALETSGAPLLEDASAGREARIEIAVTRELRHAYLALLAGALTSVIGLVFSFSLGTISLAAAGIVVRPLALVFAAVHLFLGIRALRVRAQVPRRDRGRPTLAVAVSGMGLTLALLIAGFGPDLFQSMLEAAVRFLLV